MIRLSLIGAAVYFIYSRLSALPFDIDKQVLTVNSAEPALACLAFFLVWVNWGLETVKWKRAMDPIQVLSFPAAFRSVLFGTSLGLFTPNRVGEVGGRLLLINANNRPQALLVNVFNALSQLIVTLCCGLFSLFFLRHELNAMAGLPAGEFFFYGAVVVVGGLLLILLLKKPFFHVLRRSSWFGNKFGKPGKLSGIARREWKMSLLLSSLRYVVFSFQYYLLLLFFNIQIPLLPAFLLISAIFFVNTLVPGGVLIELGVRGSAALLFLGLYAPNDPAILAATFTLWLMNLLIPALIGFFAIRKFEPIPLRSV